jgi:protease-4
MTLAMLGDIYDQFVDAVAEGRKLPREKVLQVATGRIFTGRQAMKLHLVDELGGYLDAVDLAGKKAGVRPKVVEYGHDSVLDWLVGSAETRTGLENLAADPRMAAAQSILRWGAPWGN